MRARDLGIPFDGTPGPHNAITDVAGVEVGHETLVAGDDVRTGVTAILPRPRADLAVPVAAGLASFNGYGELTGASFVRDMGRFAGPIALTSSNSIGTAHEAILRWMVARVGESGLSDWGIAVVGETWDGWLHDIDGFHVRGEHVAAALDRAGTGPVAEGSVGGGTGMLLYGYKGGIGTASRRVALGDPEYTVAALVQANFGRHGELVVRGLPLGKRWSAPEEPRLGDGSIIVIVATDAPLLPVQLARVARRATIGLARTGTCGRQGSGDLFLAFSTANAAAMAALQTAREPIAYQFVADGRLDALYEATAQATEEAILNALVAARTMTGLRGRRALGIPHEELAAAFRATSSPR
jgi:D-aminopeptidase